MRVDSQQVFARQNVMFPCSSAARTKKNNYKTIGIMSSLMDRTGSSTGGASQHKLAMQTPTSINKLSQKYQHRQQHSRKQMMMRRHQQQHRSKCPPPGAASLLLSLSIGLALAAIHSSAFTNGPYSQTAAQHPQQPAGGPSTTGSSHFVSASSYRASQPSTSAAAAEQSSSSASSNLNESPAINLIPIDQPLNSNSGAETLAAAVTPAPASPGTSPASANSRLKGSYGGSTLQLRSSFATGSSSDPTSASSSSLAHSLGGASNSQSAGESTNDELNQSSQHQQQQSVNDDDFGSEPIAQYYASSNQNEPNSPAEVAYQTIMEQQPADGVKQQQQQQQQQQEVVLPVAAKSNLVSPRQSMERRFGLFKKGQHQPQQHYGAPAMSANYAAAPFMTDCERCLAGFDQQAADLQQLEPAPLPPVSVPQPAPMGHFPIAQPFAPFKNKLFMKFPFLVKPSFEGLHSSGAGYGGGGGVHYWPAPTQTYQPHHHQQSSIRPSPSAMNQALYIRPASAYNCIQASPPLLAAAASTTSQAEVIPLTGPATKTGHSLASAKQQQQHFMHHQQQVQSGYAK